MWIGSGRLPGTDIAGGWRDHQRDGGAGCSVHLATWWTHTRTQRIKVAPLQQRKPNNETTLIPYGTRFYCVSWPIYRIEFSMYCKGCKLLLSWFGWNETHIILMLPKRLWTLEMRKDRWLPISYLCSLCNDYYFPMKDLLFASNRHRSDF